MLFSRVFIWRKRLPFCRVAGKIVKLSNDRKLTEPNDVQLTTECGAEIFREAERTFIFPTFCNGCEIFEC
jgi:hypothetical protein